MLRNLEEPGRCRVLVVCEPCLVVSFYEKYFMNTTNAFLLEHNRKQSELFCSPDQVARRALYLARHPSPVMVNKCIDGRVNVPTMTDDEVPIGVILPFRNMGGRFRIGSPSYAPYVRNFYGHVLEKMKRDECAGGLAIVTYHFSSGDRQRGCKGFNYDTAEAVRYTAEYRDASTELYGQDRQVVHVIQMGIETDNEAFIFHGEFPGSELDMAQVLTADETELSDRLKTLYPSMKQGILMDLMPFVLGNQRHVRNIKRMQRAVETLNHCENIIAVGRGFDWLHLTNKAVIVGPFSVNWLDEVVVAARIVLDNLTSGRIRPEEGAALLSCAPHRELGVDKNIAREKAREMALVSWNAIKKELPELVPYLELVVGTLDRKTMMMDRLEPQEVEKLRE